MRDKRGFDKPQKKPRNKLDVSRFVDEEVDLYSELEAHICKHDLWVEDCPFGCMDPAE